MAGQEFPMADFHGGQNGGTQGLEEEKAFLERDDMMDGIADDLLAKPRRLGPLDSSSDEGLQGYDTPLIQTQKEERCVANIMGSQQEAGDDVPDGPLTSLGSYAGDQNTKISRFVRVCDTTNTANSGDLEAEELFNYLKENKCDSISLLLENGVSLDKFLTFRRLLDLYRTTNLNIQVNVGEVTNLKNVDDFLKKLDDHTYTPLYTTKQHEVDYDNGDQTFEAPWRELFIWSVLKNRREMALLFLTQGRDIMAGCLLAARILRSIATQAREKDLEQDLQENARFFNETALGILNQGYKKNAEEAQKNLFRPLSLFGGTTVLELAVSAEDKTFISHPCCVKLLDSIWSGTVDQTTNFFKKAVCVAIPLLAPALIKYKVSDHPVAVDPNTRKIVGSITGTGQQETEKPIYAKGGVTSFREQIKISGHDEQQGQQVCSLRFKLYFTRLCQFFCCPANKFAYNFISYLLFLALYFYMMAYQLVMRCTVWDIVLIVWVASLLLEEIRQVCEESGNTRCQKLVRYLKDYWNILDIGSIFLFVVGISLKNSGPQRCFTVARFLLALDFIFFAVRLLHYTTVNKDLGPKIIMIYRMMKDLLVFLCIIGVFIVSFGVAQQVMLYPTDINSEAFYKVFASAMRRSYFQMFGELFLDEIGSTEEDGCTFKPELYQNGTMARCPDEWGVHVGYFLLAIYLFIVQVLLLNLLIAIFSNTYSAIQAETEDIWRFQRYQIIREFWSKPALAPPFIMLPNIYRLIRFVCRKYSCCCSCGSEKFMLDLNKAEDHDISAWALMRSQEYFEVTSEAHKDSTDGKLIALKDQLAVMLERVDHVQHNVCKRMDRLDRQVNQLSQQLQNQQLNKRKTY